MADLSVVKEDGPGAITAEMIAAALERRKAESVTPLEHYDAEIGGVFRFRKLTGQEVRECRKLATVGAGTPTQHVDQDKLEFLLVNKGSIEPRVDSKTWAELGQLGVMVQAGLSAAVMVANGMAGDPVEEAGKGSPANPS